MEDVATAFRGVELAQHLPADGLAVAAFPDPDVAVAAEADAVAELAAQLHGVQGSLGFERVVSVNAHLNEVGEDRLYVAAAVVDNRQVSGVGGRGHLGNPRLEILAPVARRHEGGFLVGHVAPDNEAIQQAPARLDLGLRHLQVERAEAADDRTHALGILSHPNHRIFLAD